MLLAVNPIGPQIGIDLIELARKPGQIIYGSAGNGTPRICGELFKRMATSTALTFRIKAVTGVLIYGRRISYTFDALVLRRCM